jgi:hypothetical protein
MTEMGFDETLFARLAGLRLPAPRQALSRPPRQAQPYCLGKIGREESVT